MHKKPLLLLIWFLYIAGFAAAQDIATLRAAASAGDAAASLELSELHRFGQAGLRISPDSARYYLIQAARQGSADAQYLWGLALLQGREVQANVPAGLALLEKAAAQQHILALNVLAALYSAVPDSTFGARTPPVPKDDARAFQYSLQAAQLGDPKGAFFAGKAYLNGTGTSPNDSLAVHYLTQAGQKRYVHAQLLLGDIYLEGSTIYGVALAKARYWYGLAARHPQAGIELNTTGKVGLHNTEQATRRLHNALGMLLGIAPPGSLTLPIRR
jgi:uncharacterized protein